MRVPTFWGVGDRHCPCPCGNSISKVGKIFKPTTIRTETTEKGENKKEK
jgi:hypothetical protein